MWLAHMIWDAKCMCKVKFCHAMEAWTRVPSSDDVESWLA